MEVLEVAQYVATCLALIASVFLDRKIFVMMNCALFSFWGVMWMVFPRMAIDIHSSGGAPPVNFHVFTCQIIGIIVFCNGIMFWMFRNTTDERVTRAVLALIAQTMLGELIVFGTHHATVSSRIPEKDEKGNMKVPNEVLLKTENFWMLYLMFSMYLVASAVHYFRSPSVKLPASNHVDRPLNVHMSILFYVVFASALSAAFSPDVFLQAYYYPITSADFPSDLFMHTTVRLLASMSIAEAVFVYSAMDFVSGEDKGKVFQLNLLYFLLVAAVSLVHVFMLETVSIAFMIPMAVVITLVCLNSILGWQRSKTAHPERRESKKRR